MLIVDPGVFSEADLAEIARDFEAQVKGWSVWTPELHHKCFRAVSALEDAKDLVTGEAVLEVGVPLRVLIIRRSPIPCICAAVWCLQLLYHG